MLMPALSSVRYKSKLVVCANSQRQIAMAALLYATENDARYPKRDAFVNPANSVNTFSVPSALAWDVDSAIYNDLPMMTELFDVNGLSCPLKPFEVDYTDESASLNYYTYALYFGWDFGSDPMERSMSKVGKILRDKDGVEYDVLCADYATMIFPATESRMSHPGPNATAKKWTGNKINSYYSASMPTIADLNFAHVDGSVNTIKRINVWNPDTGVNKTPYKYNDAKYSFPQRYLILPPVE